MTYSFKYKELKCLKKLFKLNNLYGINNCVFPCFFYKNRLIHAGIIEKKTDKYEFTSLYKELFHEWTNMKYIITFYGQGHEKVDKHILMINPNKIITYEENIYDVMVGYYLYETIGIRNYILDHIDVHFEMKVPEDMKFRLVLNKDEYEKFMNLDESLLDSLAKQCNIHKSVLKKYAGKMSTRDILKTIVCNDVINNHKMCIDLVTDKNANYLLKRILCQDNIQYVLSICDSSILPFEIQNMSE